MDRDDLAWLDQFRTLALSTEEQKALVYAHKTGRVDNAAYRSLNRADTLTASRSLTRLERSGPAPALGATPRAGGLLHAHGRSKTNSKVTPKVTSNTTSKTQAELLILLGEGKRLAKADTENLILLLCAEAPNRPRVGGHPSPQRGLRAQRLPFGPRERRSTATHRHASPDPNVAYRAKAEGQ